MIAGRGMHRPRPGRWASILLSTLVLLSLLAGLAHSTGVLMWIGPLTAMEIHVVAAIAAVPFVIWHVAARRVRMRHADLSRRTFLRGGIVLAGAAATYAASEVVVRAASLPGATRRFTGSYEAGSFQPQTMPMQLLDVRRGAGSGHRELAAHRRWQAVDFRRAVLFRRPGHGHARLHRRLLLDPGMGRGPPRQARGAHRCGQHQGRLEHRIRPPVPAGRGGIAAARDADWWSASRRRPRLSGSSGGSQTTPRVLVGEMGYLDRPRRPATVVAESVPPCSRNARPAGWRPRHF